jgi:flavin-dependent dehydrogenase
MTQQLLSLNEAATRTWDVVVVGAGPAGSIAARELARSGCRTLLVEKKTFPRPKVCGACLSSHALEVLDRVGLGGMPRELGGRPYDQFRLWSQGNAAELRLPQGIAVTRAVMDNRLVELAVESGVAFLSGTQAELGPPKDAAREIRLRQPGAAATISARAVIAADGITGTLLEQEPGTTYRTWRDARIGAGAVIHDLGSEYETGAIHMGVAQHGYVGLVRVEDGGLNVGAALDMRLVRRAGGIPATIATILDHCGLPTSEAFQTATWRGTSPMTRRASSAGGHRLFAIGDAAGYAEPFTGEGMAWAMTSAIMVVPFVLETVRSWRPEISRQWTAAHRRALRSRQNACFRLATLLRFPHLVHCGVLLLSLFPSLASPLVRRLNRVPKEIDS